MKRISMLLLLVLALVVAGCGGAPESANRQEASAPSGGATSDMAFEGAMEAEAPAMDDMEDMDDGAAATGEFYRMIIYNANISMVVKDTLQTQEEIAEMVKRQDGYLSSAESYKSGENLVSINLTLRVPAEKFTATMAELRDMAREVERESISSEDVTQEYVDLESRLTALEAKAERLEELMEEAEDTEAVLAIYRELSSTQQEIEQTKGRMRYLERSAAMATISVHLTPDELSRPVEVAGWRPQGTAKRAIEALIEVFQWLFKALIWIVLLVLPVTIFVGLVIFGIIKLLGLVFRPRRRAKTEEKDSSEE
jgi:hypothetical protein